MKRNEHPERRSATTIGAGNSASRDVNQTIGVAVYQLIQQYGDSGPKISIDHQHYDKKVITIYELGLEKNRLVQTQGELQDALAKEREASTELREKLKTLDSSLLHIYVKPVLAATAIFALTLGVLAGATFNDSKPATTTPNAALGTSAANDENYKGETSLAFSEMPCAPGTYVTRLASVSEGELDKMRARKLEVEQRFISHVAKPVPLNLSRGESVCESARLKEPVSRMYLYAGPFTDAAEAKRVCDDLMYERSSNDCYPVEIKSP